MTYSVAPLLRVPPSVLLCLTLTGTEDAAASTGVVVGWGDDGYGQATPPEAVNGWGAATEIARASITAARSRRARARSSAGAATTTARRYPPTPSTAFREPRPASRRATTTAARSRQARATSSAGAPNFNGEATPPDTVNGVFGTATDISGGLQPQLRDSGGHEQHRLLGRRLRSARRHPPTPSTAFREPRSKSRQANDYNCAIQAGTDIRRLLGRQPQRSVGTPPDAVNGVAGTASDCSGGRRPQLRDPSGHGQRRLLGGRLPIAQATPPDAVNGISGTASCHRGWHLGYSCAIQAGTGNVVCWGTTATAKRRPPTLSTAFREPRLTSRRALGPRLRDPGGHGQRRLLGLARRRQRPARRRPPMPSTAYSGTATDIAAGEYHSTAQSRRARATSSAGAGTTYGQATPPDSVNGLSGTATDITAGAYHSCAIQAGTGNAVCWGDDSIGQATPPDSVNGVSGTATDIAAGHFHSCAIQAGTGEGRLLGATAATARRRPPDAVNGVSGTATDIAAGYYHSCAIQAGTGNVVCWGSDGTDGRRHRPPTLSTAFREPRPTSRRASQPQLRDPGGHGQRRLLGLRRLKNRRTPPTPSTAFRGPRLTSRRA